MAVNSSSLQETILKAIDAVVTQRNNDLKLDKTITGIIQKNAGIKKGGKPVYEVEYSGGIIEAMTQYVDDIYTPKTSVYVLVPQGDFSKDKIIIGRASAIQTDRTSSVVAAAVNKYSITGSNLLESTSNEKLSDLEFGLRSFHEKELEESQNPELINHRAYFIYQKDIDGPIKFADDRLNIYKEESSAIMVKADFKTNLDVVQKNQSGARYGLIFNFAFDNLNKGWGETNGEILGKVSKIVSGTIEVAVPSGTTTQEITWEDYVINDFYNRLTDPNITNDDVENWISDSGLLDQEAENTQALYQVFQTDQSELNTDIIRNTVQAYLALLQELKGYSKIAPMRQRYNEWLEEVVGDSSQKFEQFVLTSDDMIGNPFDFKNWNTQYAVFEINLETFNHLDSILFYHQGFVQNVVSEWNWPLPSRYNANRDQGGPDIFVKNLQIYAMNPLDSQSGDYILKVEPSVGMDMIISEKTNSTTQFKATLLRKMYEDLTANVKVSYYWFKESSYVINADSTGYHYLGGPGWRKLDHNETNYLFTSTVDDNTAYKNNYKCVAVYEPAADDKTVLSCPFTIYNEDKALDIKLESDKGTRFSFDAGAPIITVLINKNRTKEDSVYEEIGFDPETENPEFIYHWTVEDASNGYPLFLEETTSEANTVQDIMLLDAKQDLLKRIKKYVTYTNEKEIVVTDQIEASKRATRIEYPVSISSSGFVVTCYVQQWSDKKKDYVDIGSASLEFENQDASIVSSYYIQIVNGDQVFQYDEYGKSPCDESKKDPLVVKPLQAKLFTPKGTEVSGTNYVAEWIIPIENTMLSTTVELQRNSNTNLIQNYTGSELAFSIAKIYDYNAYNNQITCHINFNGKDYYKDTNFYIGKIGNNGTNGTDVVAKIVYTGSDIANLLHYQPLTLYVQDIKNEDGTIKHQGMWNVGASGLKDEVAIVSEQDGLNLNVYQKGSLLGSSNFNMGYPRWNVAGNASGTINNTAKFFSIGESGQSLTWKYDTNSDEKFYQMQNIRAEVSIKDDKEDQEDATYYAFFSLPIIKYEVNSEIEYKFIVEQEENNIVISKGQLPVNKLLPSNRIAINREFYLNEIVYNADGRNPIYNHNQGLELINLPEGAVVIWTVKGGLNAIRSGFSNSIKQVLESKPSIKIVTEKDGIEGATVYSTLGTSLLNKARIYIRPNDTFDGAATNNRIEAQVYVPKTEIQKSQEQQAVRNAIKKKYEEKIELKYQEALSLFEDYYLRDMQDILERYKDDEDARNTALEVLSKEYGKHFLTLQDEIIKTFEGVDLTNEIAKEALKTVIDKLIAKTASDTSEVNWETLRKTIEENIFPWLPAPILKEDEIPELPELIEDDTIPDFVNTADTISNVQDKIYVEKREETYRELFGDMYDSIKKWSENIQEKIKNNNCTEEDLDTLYSQINELANQVIDQFEFSNDSFTFKNENGNEETISYKDYLNRIKSELLHVFDNNVRLNANIIAIDHLESFMTDIESSFIKAINDDIDFEQKTDPMKDFYLLATVYAPIHMALNTFGLASVNAWDGNSIAIDDERGAVLAPQVAAGEKDSNNRFTGIVMGKTKTYTGDAEGEKQTGLFGYAYGLQSIFLDAETGNATFGLPEGDALKKDSKGHYNGLIKDDYGEGRIELRPGDISKIGGWRLGRRSLYYIEGNKEIGERYSNDYIPNTAGDIVPGDKYNKHHEKDIKEEDAGILLHSGTYPYLSIKGKRLNLERDELAQNDSLSYLMDDDSLEVQIDPYTPTLFTIFRHNGQVRYNRVIPEGETPKPSDVLYPVGSRTYLAGINARGQLVANGLQNVTAPTENSSGESVTSLGINRIPAFGEIQENASHIGLLVQAANKAVAKLFIKEGSDTGNNTLYISGSINDKTEYSRPISIHGKDSISLFVATANNISTSTTSNIKISTTSSQIQLNSTILKLTSESDNLLETRGLLNINLGAEGQRRAFGLNAASSSVNLYTGTTNYYKQVIDDTNGIKVTTSKPYDYTSASTNYNINLSNIKINASNNKLQLFNSGLTYTNSILLSNDNGTWETSHDLTFKGKNQLRVQMTNNGTGSQYNSTDAWAQILIQAGTAAEDQSSTQLFLNSSDNTWTTGSNGKGTQTGSKINSWFRVNTTRTDNGIYLYDRMDNDNALTYFGIDVHQLSLGGQFSMKEKADKIFFTSTKIDSSGVIEDSSAGNGGYIAQGSNLANLISDCLRAANSAKAAADAAQTAADNAQARADSAYTIATTHSHTVKVSGTATATATITAAEVEKHASAKAYVNGNVSRWSVTGSGVLTETKLGNAVNASSGSDWTAGTNEGATKVHVDNVDITGTAFDKSASASYTNTVTTTSVTY